MTRLDVPITNNNVPQLSRSKRLIKNLGITLGLISLLFVISIPLRTVLDSQNIILIYSLFVLIISYLTPGYFMGFVSAVLCTILFDFLINKPWYSFQYTIKLPITLLIMLVVTTISSAIAAYQQEITQRALEGEKQAETLYKLNQQLMSARSKENIVAIANEYLVNLTARSVVFYLSNPAKDGTSYYSGYPDDLSLDDFVTRSERRAAAHAFENGAPAGFSSDYHNDSSCYYLPIEATTKPIGVIGVSCKNSPIDEKEEAFLKLAVSQLSMALQRQQFDEEQKKTQIESEKERMRSGLLRAISHDLRTPLTSILGASNTLIDESAHLDQRTSLGLVKDIKEQSEWLIRMVENLLAVTRISDGDMQISKSPEAAEEVVAYSVNIIRKWYPDWSIHVKVPEDLLIVPIDATLISQVLINLMENSVKSSTPNDLILVNLKKSADGREAVFEISDNGSGISEELLENLFDTPSQSPTRTTDAAGGTGIGLSICSTIVKAHGGSIGGRNKSGGGALFAFTLPLEETNE